MQESLQQRTGIRFNSRWWLGGVLVLVGIALFPYGLIPFGRILSLFPEFHQAARQVYATWYAHVVGHALIFVIIGTAVLLSFPSLSQRPKLYLSLMAVLGVMQEFFQLVGFKHRTPVFDDLFDVFVDFSGAIIAFFLVRLMLKLASSFTLSQEGVTR
jgi:glycopeptide antibiotics resistance protein